MESRAPTAVHFVAEGRPDFAGLGDPRGGVTIRYAHALGSSAAMLDRPGKKEALVASVAAAVGRPVAVTLVVDDAPPPTDAPADSPRDARPPRTAVGRGAAVPAPLRPDDDPGPRDRPADIPFEQFEQDPLVRALMDTLGAKIVKVEKE